MFLYGFLVPMLPYMLQERLHLRSDQTQRFTSISLALHGLVSVFGGPLIGHFADNAPNRKIPFLIALVGCIIGTFMVACATSVGVFFGGRALQGISGSGAWIVGLATAANAVDPDQIGTTMGILMAFVNAGVMTGPMVSGFILEAAGYWFTWSVPVVLLLIDVAARLLIVESSERPSTQVPTQAEETDNLLPSPEGDGKQSSAPSSNFWRIMLSNCRVITVLAIGLWGPALNTSFNATIPLHVLDIFGWGPSVVGLMFFLLAIPGLFVSPLAGYLRDRIGTRKPASMGLGLQAVFLVLLGFAGNSHFDWACSGGRGPALYILSIVTIGILRPFVSGVGAVELTSIVKAEEAKNPGIFGPGGGHSRVFSLIEVAATAGMTIGPVISGALVERFDYFRMNWILSVINIVMAALAFTFLKDKDNAHEANDERS
ncbi:putative MFS-type transporter C18,02 [Talaromyces islandicus]|uniref:Putative MFS-type transporter C18,02 n=1 Tax=Talaromyces islandicus TaxID=28573 RepID=A0A0U1LKF7_TALIS|nr:putative MFS-type transporter C18,02 [Talaromyces islandicus]